MLISSTSVHLALGFVAVAPVAEVADTELGVGPRSDAWDAMRTIRGAATEMMMEMDETIRRRRLLARVC